MTNDDNFIPQVTADGSFTFFFDPFSPPQRPQLWTIEFIQKVSMCLHVDGFLATYSCAAAVRTVLLAADLQIGCTPPVAGAIA
ncbi:hypothetical protein NIES4075_16920 [Tolypothrix sp. NIES-4075]|nr:hypothetical protein NIES4075_16920 [Tolypothrix sp. NIES-4075]